MALQFPTYVSPRTKKEYPFFKPNPTDDDFAAFEREIEERETSETAPSSEYRFLNNAIRTSPLGVVGQIPGLLQLAANPSKIPGAVAESTAGPVRRHGLGATLDMIGMVPGLSGPVSAARAAFDPSRRNVPALAMGALGIPTPEAAYNALEALPGAGGGYTDARKQAEAGDYPGAAGTFTGNTLSLAAGGFPRTITRMGTAVPRVLPNAAGRGAFKASTDQVRNIFDEGLMYGSAASGARKAERLAGEARGAAATAATPTMVRGKPVPYTPPDPGPLRNALSTARGFFNRAGDDLSGGPASAYGTPAGVGTPPRTRRPLRPPAGAGGVVEPARLPHEAGTQRAYTGMDPNELELATAYVNKVVSDPRLATGAPARALDLEGAMLDAAHRGSTTGPQAAVGRGLAADIRTQIGRGHPAAVPHLNRLGPLDESRSILERASRGPEGSGVPLTSDVKYGFLPWLVKRSQGMFGQYGSTALDLADETLPPLLRAAILSQLAAGRDPEKR